MKLWLISQTVNRGYNTFDSAVVAAETVEDAQKMHPQDGRDIQSNDFDDWVNDWVDDVNLVNCKYLGEAKPGIAKGVLCASYKNG